MNLELFIAKRIHFEKKSKKTVSRPAVFIAMLGIAIGMAVMILSVAVVVGFKKEIREKVIGFGGHVRVTNYDANASYETQPIAFPADLREQISQTRHVRTVSEFATKPGIVKTDDDFQGVVVKGVGADFDWNFFSQNLLSGEVPAYRNDTTVNEVLVSKILSDKMRLKTGDSFLTYFVQDKVRVRKFKVSGIYSTGFKEYDNAFILADIHHVQKLNGWKENEVSGLEVNIDDYAHLDNCAEDIYFLCGNRFDENGAAYYVQTIREVSPEIFNWLDLLDMNVWVILVLMISVAGFNMLSGLLILILEKANMIGVLKSMGAQNYSIRKIFLCQSAFLVLRGMFWGNVVGLSLCLLQKMFGIVALDAEVYYLSVVPIHLTFVHWLLLNVGTFVISVLMMVVPSYMVAKITPARSMRFD